MGPLEVSVKVSLSGQQEATLRDRALDLPFDPWGSGGDSGGIGVVNRGVEVVQVCGELALFGERRLALNTRVRHGEEDGMELVRRVKRKWQRGRGAEG